ncbi:MAG: aldehyde ferredoxin oxidoreductase, partial [Bacillota bacterium]
LGPDKVRAFTYSHLTYSLYNCLPLCIMFAAPTTALDLTRLEKVVQAVTGENVSGWELMKMGERAATMARFYNGILGAGRGDDALPPRLMAQAEPPEAGGAAPPGFVARDELEKGLDLFYGLMGWDEGGRPTEAKLQELDLGWLSPKGAGSA